LREGAVEALDLEEPQLKLSLLLLELVEKVNPVLIVGLVRGYDVVQFILVGRRHEGIGLREGAVEEAFEAVNVEGVTTDSR
jgi:hypothetical protein